MTGAVRYCMCDNHAEFGECAECNKRGSLAAKLERAFRGGYEQAKRDAIDRCRVEKDGRGVADNAIDQCIRAIEPLDVRHALARLS